MATSQMGKDGAYRMTIESRYKKLAGVRRDAKLLSILAGLYGFLKLGLASVPSVVYGESLDQIYIASIVSILLVFVLFSAASGGGKPHLEKPYLLWFYVIGAAILGSKAIVDLFNNPLLRSMLLMHSRPVATPYDQSVAKFLVQKLNLYPETAIRDVDSVNLALDALGAFFLLASAAATTKYLWLKKLPSKDTDKKTS